MKKSIVFAGIVLCASVFTSCRPSVYERAYEAECNYRLAKEGVRNPSDTTKYKREFESVYRNMEAGKRTEYKKYRLSMKRREQMANDDYERAGREMEAMLNN